MKQQPTILGLCLSCGSLILSLLDDIILTPETQLYLFVNLFEAEGAGLVEDMLDVTETLPGLVDVPAALELTLEESLLGLDDMSVALDRPLVDSSLGTVDKWLK